MSPYSIEKKSTPALQSFGDNYRCRRDNILYHSRTPVCHRTSAFNAQVDCFRIPLRQRRRLG